MLWLCNIQPESDGSRSGSSLSLRNIAGNDAAAGAGAGGNSSIQSPTHRGVHRSISASSTKPSRRASSGAETLRKCPIVVNMLQRTTQSESINICYILANEYTILRAIEKTACDKTLLFIVCHVFNKKQQKSTTFSAPTIID